MAQIFSFCNVSVAPVYAEAQHRAEQTTQLLFGEKAIINEVNNRDWAHIRCGWDGYTGWIKVAQLTEINQRAYKHGQHICSGSHKGRLLAEESEMALPLGAELIGLKSGKLHLQDQELTFKGKRLNRKKVTITPQSLIQAGMQYLHAPYQWGGRSIMGIDCSGLTQMAFKLNNQAIPRNAHQQAEMGITVDFLQHAVAGDLAFFDNKEGTIVHVGILIDDQHILHAADANGKVVVDRIDQGGIVSKYLRKRTHHLRFVKRLFDNGQYMQQSLSFLDAVQE
jgi:hypothetical protein